MKILITGAKGFIGRNLIAELKNRNYTEIFEYDKETETYLLDEYCKQADFIFHLAGVNRPKDENEYLKGNFGFTNDLIDKLKNYNNNCPILVSSSIQAELKNPYGESKKASEKILAEYGKESGAKILIYRLPNVFGKWCKPNYNSVIATFCHNIARDLPIIVNDSSVLMNLVYIDDVINEFINALECGYNKEKLFYEVPIIHNTKLGDIVDLLYSFRNSRSNRYIPNMTNALTRNLYSTYISYLPENQFNYDLKMNIDNRGSFTEFIKTGDCGQVSVNISKPGITKGNHWHHSKIEKFLVVSGKGVIRFRKIDSSEIYEYFVSSDKMEVIDIPAGYTHNIENLGDCDMVTIMWVSETFDANRPDTYYLEV